MKNLMISLTFVLLLIGPFAAIAELTVAATVNGKTVTLSFQESAQLSSQSNMYTLEKRKVILKDRAGYTLYQESVSVNYTPEKNYNLKDLPDGEYLFEVSGSSKITVKPFLIKGEEIVLMDEKFVFKPTIAFKENIASFNLLAFKHPVHISIVDSDGEELYSEVFTKMNSIGKRFDFSSTPEGIYTISTSVQGQYFIKDIEVQ